MPNVLRSIKQVKFKPELFIWKICVTAITLEDPGPLLYMYVVMYVYVCLYAQSNVCTCVSKYLHTHAYMTCTRKYIFLSQLS